MKTTDSGDVVNVVWRIGAGPFKGTLVVCLAWSGFLMTASAQAPVSEGSRNDLPPEVRGLLQKQAAAIGSSHIEYRVVTASEALPTANWEATHSEDFDGNRFYWRRTMPVLDGRGKTKTGVSEVAFDGDIAYSALPGRRAGIIRARVDDDTDPIRENSLAVFAYLEAAGFYVPDSMVEMHNKPAVDSLVLLYLSSSDSTRVEKSGEHLRVTLRIPDSELLAARKIRLSEERKRLERSVRSAKADKLNVPLVDVDKEMSALKHRQEMPPKRTVTFLLDARRGYAVVEREEWTATGQRIVRVEPDRWKYYEAPGVWLPGRCTVSYYTQGLTIFSNAPIVTSTADLKLVRFGPVTGVEFALDQKPDYKKPGTQIVDRSTSDAQARPSHQVVQILSADGTLLRNVASDAYYEINRPTRVVLLCLAVVLGLSPAAIWLIQRRNGTKG